MRSDVDRADEFERKDFYDYAVVIEDRHTKLRFYTKKYSLAILCLNLAPISLCLIQGNHAYYVPARCIELAIKVFCMIVLLHF